MCYQRVQFILSEESMAKNNESFLKKKHIDCDDSFFHSPRLNYMEMRHLNFFESCCTKGTKCLFHLRVFLNSTLFAFSHSRLGMSAVICNSILCVMINGALQHYKTVKYLISSFVSPFFPFHGDHSVTNNCSCFKNWEAAHRHLYLYFTSSPLHLI